MRDYREDELEADMFKKAWYDYNPRGYHKHQIWKARHLVAAWLDADTMYSDLEALGLTINEESSVVPITKGERHA